MTLPQEEPKEGAKRPAHQSNGPRLTRRRVPVSCIACRTRKLKCNREKPCQNCTARGEGNSESCVYADKPQKKPTGLSKRAEAEDMRERLMRLESSILSIISSETEKKESPSSIQQYLVTSNRAETLDGDYARGQRASNDTRSTHWNAILSELGAMKDAWFDEDDRKEVTNDAQSAETRATKHRPGILSGLTQPPDRSTIMTSVPSRDAADKLVHRFFDSYNPQMPAKYVLHKATFLKQYNRHWTDPSKTKLIWVGLMFAVFSVAMLSYGADEVPTEYQGTCPALAELYRIRCAQCLLITDLTKPCEFMLETLGLFAMTEYSEEQDGDMGTFMLSGMMVRIALQQGYHRDPSQHPNLSVFQGEMRRRTWSAVSQHELLFSVQIGLPKSIRYSECDTESPRNIHEEELYENMTELPPARPFTEDTEISYQIVKYQVMRAYGRVVEFVNLIEPQEYESVLRLDVMLLETRALIPPHLQLGTLEEMKHEPSSRTMEKYILQLFYHKSVILLHRKYWHAHPVDTPGGQWYYSHKTCVISSLEILRHQNTMHQAAQPGGCLEKMKWYRFSLTNHDFLLAAMILCLDIITLSKPGAVSADWCLPIMDKIELIKQSRAIWAEIVDDCRDAKRAVKVLTSVLGILASKSAENRVKVDAPITPVPNPQFSPVSASATNPEVDALRYSPYFTDQFGLGIPLIANDPAGTDITMQDTFLCSLGSEIEMPSDFNWDGWDQYLAGQSLTPSQASSDFGPSFDMSNSYFPVSSLSSTPQSNINYSLQMQELRNRTA